MAKREASKASKRAGKKAKTAKVTNGLLSEIEIASLVSETLESSKYNNLVELLAQYEEIESVLKQTEDDSVEQNARFLTLNLYKCFEKFLTEHTMSSETKNEKKQLVAKWLQDKYSKFKEVLCHLVQVQLVFSLSLQLDALDVMLGLVRLEAKDTNEFPVDTYQALVKLLLLSDCGDVLADESSGNFLLLEFVDKFTKHWDLQVYFFEKSLAETISGWKSLSEEKRVQLFSSYYTVIKEGLLYSSDTDSLRDAPVFTGIKLPSTAYKSSIKTRYQKCLLEILRITELSPAKYKALLAILHKRIIPYMGVPAGLMDFLTDAYDQEDDAVVPILALNSLWELMKNYNLEYPDFYTKLYSLLTPDLMYTRYRSRFFRLCDLFLSSTHLAANLVASFIKKLARLSLAASSPAVVIVIPFIYNLLKRHPTCMVLLQNTSADSEYTDTYDDAEKDPLNTGAMGSSLWELETLMSHYHPNVATLAKIFSEPFRKPSYRMEDFLDWSYLTLLESEKTRKYKGMASLEYEDWSTLFSEGKGEKLYIEGWSF
ncbi:CBF-domain-containing protein [Metschnikowia bicuspidata var. bicuspidata NRRL YB-4993]|uniref:CBF-domain-containing protein n=1 Tax=Metschnikowia bicuspidata var. bicuspidata NRRL YB-4993 TaxID=869754 RepID=A0A1A0H4Z9_9ASCO|nr:CBF-domain-containing protein [Metschnikowia bicuspidata var. bicuspidata NRRL YB-4993]OBA19154.1 CBF-domain-containing protein [Metschnikowia bicuspidata var. bicuspidata NRRL YB-4993]